MRTIFCLLRTYFGGTRLARSSTLLGLAMVGTGTSGIVYFSRYLLGGPKSRDMSLALEAVLWTLPTVGLVITFLGGALMPIVLGRLLGSHQLHTLPHGRLKLLVSALLTPAFVALIFAIFTWALYRAFPLGQALVLTKAWVVSFISFSLMYLILWLVSKTRSAVGMLAGAMLVVLSLTLPYQFIQVPGSSLRTLVIGGLLALGGGAAAIFAWPLLKHRLSIAWLRHLWPFSSSGPIGNNLDLLIGTAKPWLLAVGQIAPFLLATRFISSPKIWLFYLSLFSVMSGAFSSIAASRSRSLWLRTPWARHELFARIELSFWRHNSYSVGVLLLLLVAIGSHEDFPIQLLAIGLPLILLGTTASTYLGLMMTKSIGWLESLCAAVTMLLMMTIALMAANVGIPPGIEIAGIAALALLALTFRFVAKSRWSRIDWTLCRPPVHSATGY